MPSYLACRYRHMSTDRPNCAFAFQRYSILRLTLPGPSRELHPRLAKFAIIFPIFEQGKKRKKAKEDLGEVRYCIHSRIPAYAPILLARRAILQ